MVRSVHEVASYTKNTYCIFSNLIHTSFWRVLKRKKSLFAVLSAPFLQPLSEVVQWVAAAWKAIPESIIIRSFKNHCISNALDGSEDDILWKDEDKDDSDWVTGNDSVMSDDGEFDE